jgi:hypothetical protein
MHPISDEIDHCSDIILKALAECDYDLFRSIGDEGFRNITQDMFSKVSDQVAEGLKGGFAKELMGQLKQNGHTVYFWKISYAQPIDDQLLRLSFKNGKVSGALFTKPFSG